MAAFSSAQELRDIFGGFMQKMGAAEGGGFSSSGVILAYTVTDPDARFVIDGSVKPTPGRAFAVHIDDPAAPEPHADIFMSADTLDKLYKGELQVMAAQAEGLVKAKGDPLVAMRLLPVMFRVVPLYRAYREKLGK